MTTTPEELSAYTDLSVFNPEHQAIILATMIAQAELDLITSNGREPELEAGIRAALDVTKSAMQELAILRTILDRRL